MGRKRKRKRNGKRKDGSGAPEAVLDPFRLEG